MKRIFNKIDRLANYDGLSFRPTFVAEIEGQFWTICTGSAWVAGVRLKGPFDPWSGDQAILDRIFEHLTIQMPNPVEIETSAIMAWTFQAPVKKLLRDFQDQPVAPTAAGKILGMLVDAHRLAKLTEGFGRVQICPVDAGVPALSISAANGLFRATLAGMLPEMEPEIGPFSPGEDFGSILTNGANGPAYWMPDFKINWPVG